MNKRISILLRWSMIGCIVLGLSACALAGRVLENPYEFPDVDDYPLAAPKTQPVCIIQPCANYH